MFAGRYLILEALSRSVWGRVYEALDLGTNPPTLCALKEFLHDAAMDDYGRDAFDYARHECAVLEHFHSAPTLPRVREYFEYDGNIYLAIEYIPGATLQEQGQVRESSGEPWKIEDLLRIGLSLATIVNDLNRRKLIIRDLKPANIIETKEGDLRIIDLAFAYRKGIDKGTPIGLGTRGFTSPAQIQRKPPLPRDDTYSWGAIMRFLATRGVRTSFGSTQEQPNDPLKIVRPDCPEWLSDIIQRATSDDQRRQFGSLRQVVEALSVPTPRVVAVTPLSKTPKGSQSLKSPMPLARALADSLCAAARRDGTFVRWPAITPNGDQSEYSPDIYSGNAGIALFLTAMANATGSARYADASEGVGQWLSNIPWSHGWAAPGLHAGDSGVGLLYLRMANLLCKRGYLAAARMRALRIGALDTGVLDIVSGTAGKLLFLVELYQETGDEDIKTIAVREGDRLLQERHFVADRPDRFYFEIMSPIVGQPSHRYLGLLHGAAGIGLALARLGSTVNESRYVEAAMCIGEFLLEEAHLTSVDGQWHYNWPLQWQDEEVGLSAHCHGGGGIAQFLLRLWVLSGDDRFLKAAEGAAISISAQPTVDMGQCHGLAGAGSLFLDLFKATSDPKYHVLAQQTASRISRFIRANKPGKGSDNTGEDLPPGYMLGKAGLGAFFLRCASPDGGDDLILPGVEPSRRSPLASDA